MILKDIWKIQLCYVLFPRPELGCGNFESVPGMALI